MTPPPLQPSEFEAVWPLTGVSIDGDLPSHPTRRVLKLRSDQGAVAKLNTAPHPEAMCEVVL